MREATPTSTSWAKMSMFLSWPRKRCAAARIAEALSPTFAIATASTCTVMPLFVCASARISIARERSEILCAFWKNGMIHALAVHDPLAGLLGVDAVHHSALRALAGDDDRLVGRDVAIQHLRPDPEDDDGDDDEGDDPMTGVRAMSNTGSSRGVCRGSGQDCREAGVRAMGCAPPIARRCETPVHGVGRRVQTGGMCGRFANDAKVDEMIQEFVAQGRLPRLGAAVLDRPDAGRADRP